jgi:carboxymethylenebutenolidase
MPEITLRSRHDGYPLPAWRADARGPRRGGVVVIQEIFGLTPHIRAMTDAFAAAGYDAIAPGLYDRFEKNFHAEHTDAGIARAREAIAVTPMRTQVAADVQTAIDALGPGPIHITGFCYGGGVAWMAAGMCAGLASAACFYGRIINQMLDIAPRIPTIAHYGEHDAAIPPPMVEEVRAAYPTVPIFLYDAGHGFCREGSRARPGNGADA